MVFYRKYRPQTIRDLDSKDVSEKLIHVFSSKSIPHAFLFTGPKGLGKTSTARILAKVVNCEKRKDFEPCNKCDQCISITNGTNLDVLEIDGASNRGIDEIRDLREKIRLSPAGASKKVYIIDEVHMLTTEAFNALLKTLEEPPAHAMFILCTTEPHKLPATIISRCFHISFHKATDEELVTSFKRIVKGEKLEIDKEALLAIAKLSDGSFRDGAKILQEISVLAGREKITEKLVGEQYKTNNIHVYQINLLHALQKHDTKKALSVIGELTKDGVDFKFFIEELVSTLHKNLLSHFGIGSSDVKLDFTVEQLKQLVQLFSKATGELKYAVLPELPIELAIIEWNQNLENIVPATQAPSSASGGQPSGRATPLNILEQLIDKIKTRNQTIAGVLRGCSLRSFENNTLVIETKFKFHKDKLTEGKTISLLEQVGEEITGKKVTISIQLTS